MILPITIIGNPVLRKKAEPVAKDYPNLKELIDNMFETMRKSEGVGLAAPQIGLSLRLFVVDASPMTDDVFPVMYIPFPAIMQYLNRSSFPE